MTRVEIRPGGCLLVIFVVVVIIVASIWYGTPAALQPAATPLPPAGAGRQAPSESSTAAQGRENAALAVGVAPAAIRPVLGPSRAFYAVPAPLVGRASWYAAKSPTAAAAGPALRVGKWRGTQVVVAYRGRSVRVTLSGFCRCPGRVIDLPRSAFARLADPSVGVLRVRVSVVGAPRLPRTDS